MAQVKQSKAKISTVTQTPNKKPDFSKEERKTYSRWLGKILALVGIMVGTLLFYRIGLTDYGVTWDEFFHRNTGKQYAEFLKTHDLNPILQDERASWFPPIASTIGYWFLQDLWRESQPTQSKTAPFCWRLAPSGLSSRQKS